MVKKSIKIRDIFKRIILNSIIRDTDKNLRCRCKTTLFSTQKSTTTAPPQKTINTIPDKYAYLDPRHEIPALLLTQALNYFDGHQNLIKNKSVVGIIDFKQHNSKRL